MGAHAFAVEGPGPGPAMRRRLAGFVATLRDAGFAIGQAEAQDAARLIAGPLADRPEGLRAGMRALFASRRSDLARFDELFDAFWRARGVKSVVRIDAEALAARSPRRFQHGPGGSDRQPEPTRIGGARGREDGAADGGGRRGGASAQEAMSKKDIAAFEGERERAEAAEIAERFARAMRARLTRRERARRRGRRLDLRATIRLSVAHGGEPLDLKFRRRKIKPLRLVALLDASGSMESYVAFFTRFLHAVTLVFRESEAFLFHTRLAHVSSALKERNPARALDRLALMAAGVGGGTKIGECLTAFNLRHAQARHPFAHLRHDPVGRLRHRPAGGLGLGDARTQAPLQAHRLAQSADRPPRLRAQRARHAGRPPLPRSARAGAQSREPRGARTLSGEDMIAMGVLEQAAQRQAKGQAFALATVVRTVSVTAAKAGAKALIGPDGSIEEGWIGGGCARAAVVKAARQCMADGQSRLVSIAPKDALAELGAAAGEERGGVFYAKNSCPSQGTMDIFVEPVLPSPRLLILGASPVAVALARLAPSMGFDVAVAAAPEEHERFDPGVRRLVGVAAPPEEGERAFVVVSTQGAATAPR